MSERESFPYRELLWEMTRAEVLLRDQGTLLGFAWTLLHPALMFAVLYGLFSKWVGRFVDAYVVYLLIGLVLWNFFQKGTAAALSSLRRARGTVLNYRFPREIVVFSAVGAVLWSSLLETAVLIAALLALGARPNAAWLLLPALVALELLFITGVGLFLAVWGTDFQDLERIWEVLSSAFFYLTPIFYPMSIVGADKRVWLELSPLTWIIEAYRGCVMDGQAPALRGAVAVTLLSLGLVAAGRALLRSREHAIADSLLV